MDDISETQPVKGKDKRKAAQALKAAELPALKSEVRAVVKRKAGQPTKWNPEKWERILECVACYGDLIELCQEPDMPAVTTISTWIRQDDKLKDDMRAAWEAFSMLANSVNNNILRGGVLSTGDFKRDEALAAQNRWFVGKTNRRDFGDKQQIDVVTHESIVIDVGAIQGQISSRDNED